MIKMARKKIFSTNEARKVIGRVGGNFWGNA